MLNDQTEKFKSLENKARETVIFCSRNDPAFCMGIENEMLCLSKMQNGQYS